MNARPGLPGSCLAAQSNRSGANAAPTTAVGCHSPDVIAPALPTASAPIALLSSVVARDAPVDAAVTMVSFDERSSTSERSTPERLHETTSRDQRRRNGVRNCLRTAIQEENIELVGRQLAVIADEVNDRYSREFSNMRIMRPETTYQRLIAAARKLFNDNVISCGRNLAFVCFGYKTVATVMQQGVFSKFMNFVILFMIQERISRWIAQHGGWRATLRYVPHFEVSSFGIITSLTVAAAVIFMMCQ